MLWGGRGLMRGAMGGIWDMTTTCALEARPLLTVLHTIRAVFGRPLVRM